MKVDGIPYRNYLGKGTDGLSKLKEEIQSENEGVIIPTQIRWIGSVSGHKDRARNNEKKAGSVVLMVKGRKVAADLIENGFRAAGRRYAAELFEEEGPDSLCSVCCLWGHLARKCPTPTAPKCAFCGKGHQTAEHQCKHNGCTAGMGNSCAHIERKCVNCKGNHYASFKGCAEKKKAVDAAKETRKQRFANYKQRHTLTPTSSQTGFRILKRNEQLEPISGGEVVPSTSEC